MGRLHKEHPCHRDVDIGVLSRCGGNHTGAHGGGLSDSVLNRYRNGTRADVSRSLHICAWNHDRRMLPRERSVVNIGSRNIASGAKRRAGTRPWLVLSDKVADVSEKTPASRTGVIGIVDVTFW